MATKAGSGKICVLAPVHPPFDIRVFSKEAVSLADAGYDVVLYVRGEGDETRAGVHIKALHYRNRLQRFLMIPMIARRALREDADIYHLHNPDTIPAGVILKMFGKTVIYDTHEDYIVRIPTKQWIPFLLKKPLAWLVDRMERAMTKLADGVIVTQPHQTGKFGGILLENYPRIDDELLREVKEKAARINTDNNLRLIYVGETNPHRGLFFMLDILMALNERTPTRMWMTGTDHGEGWVDVAGHHPAWEFVDHLGYLPGQSDVYAYISKADFGMALYEDVADLSRISSNKIYEYQTYGTPFVATALSARRAILGERSGGVFVEPGDSVAAANAIVNTYCDKERYRILAERGRRLIIEERNWGKEEPKLLALYRELFSRKSDVTD